MDLKKILKTVKLHEQEISILAGAIILLIAGIFIINYIKNFNSPNTAQQNTTSQNSNEMNQQTYTVVKGDSLWKIAQKYYQDGNKWKQIAETNNITNPQKIETGQNLVIPEITPTPQLTPVAASTTNQPEISKNTYTVVKGDSLWKIAVHTYENGYKWVNIASANNLKNPNLIHSGNIFTLPR